MDNYFTLSKVIERILMNKIKHLKLTSDNQFGFKPKHGIDMFIFALKDIFITGIIQQFVCNLLMLLKPLIMLIMKMCFCFFKLNNRGVPKV